MPAVEPVAGGYRRMVMSRAFSGIVVLALVMTACGGTDGFARDRPHGSDEVVLRVELVGGFVPREYHLASFPWFTLYGDGRILTQGAQIEIYPQPALPPVVMRQVSARAIDRIAAAAVDAGLDRDARYSNASVADAPTTVFTLTVDGRTFTTEVYALGIEDPTGDRDEEAARARIAAFHEDLTNLSGWIPADELGEEEVYEPDAWRIFVQPYGRDDVDEGLEQQPKDWPLSDRPLATFGEPGEVARCGTVEGPDADAVLDAARDANQLTPWRSAGEEWRLIFRPLLPDESGC